MRNRKHKITSMLLLLCVAGSLLAAGGPAMAASCAETNHPGGDWSMYGQNLANTRNQAAETTIDATNVGGLEAAWAFSAADHGATGSFQSTPVVAEGCVYLTTASGFVFALNADTGAIVWGGRYAETVSGTCCGGTMFAPAVHDGVVYIAVASNPSTSTAKEGPYAIALDAHTGELIWRSEPIDDEPGAYTNSSAVYFDGLVLLGTSNAEMGTVVAGGFVILDAETGDVRVRTRTIPQDQRDNGFAGGSIWSTAAIDATNKYAYYSTGQPAGWFDRESEFVNAIIKIDVDQTRPSFGEIVDVDKGTWDNAPYVDVDFAGSPTLYTDENGQPMVTAYQKSGWLHAAYRRHMTHAWSTPLSPIGTAVGNYASTATDGTNIYAMATYPGQIVSVNGTTGLPNWVSPVGTTLGANPVTYANGVVYQADGKGVLDAVDAATGRLVLARPMSADLPAGRACVNQGGGVAVARNTVFAVCGDGQGENSFGPSDSATGWLVAYRLP